MDEQTKLHREILLSQLARELDVPVLFPNEADLKSPSNPLKINLEEFGEIVTKLDPKPWGSVWEKHEHQFFEDLIEACIREKYTPRDIDRIAYHAVTGRIEMGPSLNLSVREGFRKTDAEARAFVKRMGRSYAKEVTTEPGKTQVFYGRGPSQLTHDFNYKRVGKEFGMGDDLFKNPDLALEPVFGLQILIRGQNQGWFNSKGEGLGYYLRQIGGRQGAVQARRTINVLNKAEMIADWYLVTLDALKKAAA